MRNRLARQIIEKMFRAFVGLIVCGGVAAAQSYEYDAVGRLIRVIYAAGGGVAYTYDQSYNITAVRSFSLPPAPSGVEVTRIAPTQARVNWEASPGATGYVIERRLSDSSSWEEVGRVSGDSTTFTDPNLEAGAEYVYRVAALGADGQSPFSGEAAFAELPAPSISQGSVLNGASFSAQQPVAPGSIISIFGDNIGVDVGDQGLRPFSELATSIPLAEELGGYSVRINDEEAPLFFVGGREVQALSEDGADQAAFTGQINAQVPWEVLPGPGEVIVRRSHDGGLLTSDSVEVPVAIVSPAFFTFDFGPGRVVALNVKTDEDDGVINASIAQVEGSFPGVVSQPAVLGGVVVLFANGLGPVDPPAQTGNSSLDELRTTTVAPRVFLGDTEAEVLFSGLAPQFVGLYQFNIRIPIAAVPGDEVPIFIEQGGVTSRADVTIAVRAPAASP